MFKDPFVISGTLLCVLIGILATSWPSIRHQVARGGNSIGVLSSDTDGWEPSTPNRRIIVRLDALSAFAYAKYRLAEFDIDSSRWENVTPERLSGISFDERDHVTYALITELLDLPLMESARVDLDLEAQNDADSTASEKERGEIEMRFQQRHEVLRASKQLADSIIDPSFRSAVFVKLSERQHAVQDALSAEKELSWKSLQNSAEQSLDQYVPASSWQIGSYFSTSVLMTFIGLVGSIFLKEFVGGIGKAISAAVLSTEKGKPPPNSQPSSSPTNHTSDESNPSPPATRDSP